MEQFQNNKERIIFELAKKSGGEITVSDIYANSNLSISETEEILNHLSSKNFVSTKLDENQSGIKYIFPEIKALSYSPKLFEKTGINKLILKIKYSQFNYKTPFDEIEKSVLQIAQNKHGKITLINIVERVSLTVDDAETIINSLIIKGLCKREFDENRNQYYLFPDFVNYDNPDYKSNSIPENILSSLRKKTDHYLISRRVENFHKQSEKSLSKDTFIPGNGHCYDKRWSFVNLIFFSILPMILTAGLAYFPLMFLTRYNTVKYYTISDKNLPRNLKKINKDSFFYSISLFCLYFYFVGSDGILAYYNYLFSFFI